jgi:hypothetical protein
MARAAARPWSQRHFDGKAAGDERLRQRHGDRGVIDGYDGNDRRQAGNVTYAHAESITVQLGLPHSRNTNNLGRLRLRGKWNSP